MGHNRRPAGMIRSDVVSVGVRASAPVRFADVADPWQTPYDEGRRMNATPTRVLLRRYLTPWVAAACIISCANPPPLLQTPLAFAPPPVRPTIAANLSAEQTFLVDGQRTVLLLPRRSRRRLVLFSHGSGETIESILQDEQKEPIFAGLLARGFAIAASDDFGTNWGVPWSVNQLVDLQRAAGRRFRTHQTVLVAQSMGGLDAFLAAPRLLHLKAVVGIFPVCNAQSVYDLKTYAYQMDAAYGVTAVTERAALASRSPVPFPGVAWLHLRLLMFASDADRAVPKATNARACATAARAAGAAVTLVDTVGDHGDNSNFQPHRTVAFLDR